jgi:phage FluMu protein Com
MQTCSRCNTQSPDNAILCGSCQSDLREYSTTAVALREFQQNPRVKYIRVSVGNDACPACHAMQGTYAKDKAPTLPHASCSHDHGCRCFYEPFLDELYP